MVVADGNVIGIFILETKADPPLIIDRDGVLTLSVAGEGMQLVTWRYEQILQTNGEVQILKFARGALLDIWWQTFQLAVRVQCLRFAICKAFDHS